MWNVENYNEALKNIRREGSCLGEPVKTFQQIYELLGSKLDYESETIEAWRRRNSNGPGDTSVWRELEELLNLPAGALSCSPKAVAVDKIDVDLSQLRVSDFSKGLILNVYQLFLESFDKRIWYSYETYEWLLSEMEKSIIGIPEPIRVLFSDFIFDEIDPFVFNLQDAYKTIFPRGVARWNEELCTFIFIDGDREINEDRVDFAIRTSLYKSFVEKIVDKISPILCKS